MIVNIRNNLIRLVFVLIVAFLSILFFQQKVINAAGLQCVSPDVVINDGVNPEYCGPANNSPAIPANTTIPVASPSIICAADSGTKNEYRYVIAQCCQCLTGGGAGTNSAGEIGCSADNATTGNTWTAIGCIPSTKEGLATSIARILFGIGLFIMLIKIVIAGYNLQFSDEPEKLKESKQEIISIILGFIVASMGIIILNFIGYDLLGLGPILNLFGTVLPKN